MTTIKSYTDIKQSKKLAKILQLESADMFHFIREADTVGFGYKKDVEESYSKTKFEYIPCWSLAALLDEIPSTITNNVGEDLKLHIDKDDFQYYLFYENEYTGNMFEIETELYENMIDACYEMILKLHKLKML